MTATEDHIRVGAPTVEVVEVEVDGVAISARVVRVPRPRAVIVALHGGATTSVYFDCPGHPELSLLRAAAEFGFSVVALDRPGYGASAPIATLLTDPHHRLDLVLAAVDRLVAPHPTGAGLFVLAHSVGSEMGLRMAATDRAANLLGLSLSGTGREQQPRARTVLATGGPGKPPRGVFGLIWEPSRLYPPDVLGGARIASPTPDFEGETVRRWPAENFPALARRVRVPVQFLAAEHERVWRADAGALDDIADLFTAAPEVRVGTVLDSGHNISVGNTARAYHLSVLEYVEHCIARRTKGSSHAR
ncbi:MAG TPA: alpha/beta fold hydrolase [Aldersonia sp.]